MARLVRIFVQQRLFVATSVNPAVTRLCKLTLYLLILWHAWACLYWYVATRSSDDPESAFMPLMLTQPTPCTVKHDGNGQRASTEPSPVGKTSVQ